MCEGGGSMTEGEGGRHTDRWHLHACVEGGGSMTEGEGGSHTDGVDGAVGHTAVLRYRS